LELAIANKLDRSDLRAFVNYQLGNTYIAYRDYSRAAAYLDTAKSVAQNEFKYIVVASNLSYGEIYRQIHAYRRAEEILLTALRDARAHNMKDYYLMGFEHLIAVYRSSGDFRKAVAYMDTMATIKDSLVNSDKAKAILQFEVRAASEVKDRQLAENKLLIAQQQAKILRKNVTIGIFVFSVLLIGVLLLMLFFRQRHKEYMQAEQIRTLQQENTISRLKGELQGEENERGRLARELHDGIGGKLAAAILQLSATSKEAAAGQDHYRTGLDLLDEIGSELRTTAHNLMPELLLRQNIDEAVSTYCRQLSRGSDLKVDCQHFGDFGALSEAVKLNTYRIIQELLKNVLRHAAATAVLVQLSVRERLLTITIEDNGVGFDRATIREGVGLQSLESRVKSMNGSYSLSSEPGKGTSVYIEIEV